MRSTTGTGGTFMRITGATSTLATMLTGSTTVGTTLGTMPTGDTTRTGVTRHSGGAITLGTITVGTTPTAGTTTVGTSAARTPGVG